MLGGYYSFFSYNFSTYMVIVKYINNVAPLLAHTFLDIISTITVYIYQYANIACLWFYCEKGTNEACGRFCSNLIISIISLHLPLFYQCVGIVIWCERENIIFLIFWA